MGINISKYFKTHRDDYGFLYAIETVGDERELIKEIRKQNEEIEQFNSTLDEIEDLINKIDTSMGCDYGDYDCENCSDLKEEIVCSYKLKNIILQKIEKVKGKE